MSETAEQLYVWYGCLKRDFPNLLLPNGALHAASPAFNHLEAAWVAGSGCLGFGILFQAPAGGRLGFGGFV